MKKVSVQMLYFVSTIFSFHAQYASYTPVANTPGTTVWQIEDQVQGILGGNFTIAQVDIPATLTVSGTYALAQDVSQTGGAGAPGILIAADNITLDLKGHTMTRTLGQALIVIGAGVNNVTVRNGFIQDIGTTFVAEALFARSGASNIIIENIDLTANSASPAARGTGIGLLGSNVDCVIRNCSVANYDTGISVQTGTNVSIDSCTIANTQLGSAIACVSNSTNISVKNILVEEGLSGITVDLSTFVTLDNIIIENVGTTTVNNHGVNIGNCSSCALTSVDVIGTGNQTGIPVLGIDGIIIDSTNGCTLDRCTVLGASGTGIAVINSSTDIIIRGCTVNECANAGISFQAPLSPTNHVYNTIASNNAGGNFIGTTGTLIATSVVDTTTANYWYNVGY